MTLRGEILVLMAAVLAAPIPVPAAAQNFGVTEGESGFLPDFSAPADETIGGGIVVEELTVTTGEDLVVGRPRAAPEIKAAAAAGAVLRGLDKVNGQVVDMELAVGEAARMGRLTVTLEECRYPVDNPAGDAFALVRVDAEGLEAPAFEGWMIASSPALSALEHPRYDVWVIRCRSS
jgi:hypothetical protein